MEKLWKIILQSLWEPCEDDVLIASYPPPTGDKIDVSGLLGYHVVGAFLSGPDLGLVVVGQSPVGAD